MHGYSPYPYCFSIRACLLLLNAIQDSRVSHYPSLNSLSFDRVRYTLPVTLR
nr:MAG TPA: hypothetical protein [Caudoviricetes sp.]